MRTLKFATAALATAAIFSMPSAHAQATKSNPCTTVVKKHRGKKAESPCDDVRKMLADQQAQIDALKQQLANQQAPTVPPPPPEIDPIATPLAQKAESDAQAAEASSSSAVQTAQAADVKATDANKKVDALHDEVFSPAALHYKGINITPGGFVAFEGVYRQHSVNSDVNTPFNSIPFPSATEGHVSELNFSGRQSRLSVLAQSKPTPNLSLTGYYEMDFLGTGTSSNNNQSNSYVLRQRQIWGQAALASGFTVTGGQMWSLVTEDRKGTDARTEIQPQTIDSQYLVGYSWERQPGIRVQQRWGDLTKSAFTVAVAAEQAQITSFTVASSGALPADYFFGGIGQNGGLYNAAGNIGGGNTAGTGGITTYANNVAPDVLAKVAYDAPAFHIEIGGIARFMRDYYFPILNYNTTTAAYTYASSYVNNTKTAGGVFGSVRGYIANKKVEVALQGMAGTGTGRYGSSQLADATLRPDETLAPIKNYHGLYSTEIHVTPKFDVFFYGGAEYAQRTIYTTSFGTTMGYAPRNLSNAGCYNTPTATGGSSGTAGSISATGTCAEPTRAIYEAMGGIQWRPISSPKYGKLQYSATYSYIQRNLWSSSVASTTTPSGPRATEPMIHVQMRYYIP
ncbi:hypothetical protein [Granulicella paludicola]|uniref:hypothetical protein n=1 Tax=Granulicella paludicola TaxID=474951 RepID=UPI0021DF6914|nr:hypothetical protein [Granulicella paludicola]